MMISQDTQMSVTLNDIVGRVNIRTVIFSDKAVPPFTYNAGLYVVKRAVLDLLYDGVTFNYLGNSCDSLAEFMRLLVSRLDTINPSISVASVTFTSLDNCSISVSNIDPTLILEDI